jgi:3-oxoacyl-[acyl-carrier protein] reductase
VKAEYEAKIPGGKFGKPEDVAGIITFLASDAASFISGQDVLVNGGKVSA